MNLLPISPKVLLLAAASLSVGLGSVRAADYFLHQSQSSGWNWHQIGNVNGWYTARVGGAFANTVNGGVFDTEGHYYTNGFQVRSPENSNENTFDGAKLILESASSLVLKTTNGTTARAIVPYLETQGASSIIAGNSSHYHNLTVTTFDQAGTTTFTAAAGRSIDITIGTLNGSGSIVFSGGSTTSNFRLTSVGAAGFSGDFSLNTGTLLFAGDFLTAGTLNIASGTTVNLTHSVTASGLTIAGDALADGVYDYAYLSTNYGAIFTDGDELTGQIIVGSTIPEPSAFALLAGGLAFGAVALRRRRRRD